MDKQNPLNHVLKSETASEVTVLGEQLKDPYKLSNMIAAKRILEANQNATLQPTHTYVKFTPQSVADIANLSAWANLDLEPGVTGTSIDLYPYPLDYEIVVYGDYYVDPDNSGSDFPSLWAYVPVSMALPSVPVQHICEMYEPLENEETLEDKANELCGYNPDSWLPEGEIYVKAGMIYPKGNIYVYDEVLQQNMPARQIKVRGRRFLKVSTAITNDMGYFVLGKKFKGNVQFEAIGDNDRLNILYMNGGTNIFTLMTNATGYLGSYNQNTYNNLQKIESYQTVSGQIIRTMNAHLRFRDYVPQFSMPIWNRKLRIWLRKRNGSGSNNAATPMFKQMITDNSPFGAALAWMTMMQFPPLMGQLTFVMPDMVYDIHIGNQAEYSHSFNQTAFHEHGHALHYFKRGHAWYSNLVLTELTNGGTVAGPYGYKNWPGGGEVALAESWADFVGDRFALKMYESRSYAYIKTNFGASPNFSLSANFVNYPYFRVNMETWESKKNEISVPSKWIPYGVFCDLVDVKNIHDGIFYKIDEDMPDKLSGYGGTLAGDYGNDLSKFHTILGQVDNIEQYRNKFKIVFVSAQDAQNYDELWNYYW